MTSSRPHSNRSKQHHGWIWVYRYTLLYIAVMVTVAVVLLLRGAG